jgi:autotransporter-associated beta strand protein
MIRISSLLILVGAIWLFAPFAAEAGYFISTIYSPDPNNLGVEVNGVSPTGRVVGDYLDAGGTSRGYLYDPKTGVYTKYDYPGGLATAVSGLNDFGQFVGSYATSSSNFGFLNSGGVAQKIAPFGAIQSLSHSINTTGQIVGWYRTLGHQFVGYIGDPIHGYTTLQSPVGIVAAGANGLNDAGDVVGQDQDSSGIEHGFFAIKPSYTVTQLDYPGSNFTIAQGINSAGTIAGYFSFDGGNTTHGFLDAQGVFTQFDVPGSSPGTTAIRSINDAGQLVGDYIPLGGTRFVGFLATPGAAVWTGMSSTNWSDSGNWSDTVPGGTTGTANTNIAVFNQNAPNSPLVIDAGRNLQNITFDTPSVNSLTVGTIGGNPLLLTAGGTIQTTSTVVSSQTINAPLVLEGSYEFTSGAASSSATIIFGGKIMPGATSGVTMLTLNGANTGANTIGGVLADNGSGILAVTKSDPGLWVLSGPNTYSGGTTVVAGTLRFNVTSGAPSVAAGATVSVASGATLELAGTISALGSAGGNRAHIVNSSTASGVLISGTNQVVGGVDGSGNVHVNAGSDLTADHIIQNALIIGGSAGARGLVTIDASDALGNPLAAVGLATTTPIPNAPLDAGANLVDPLGYFPTGDSLAASLPLVSAVHPAAVPEPSTLLMFAVGELFLAVGVFRRHVLQTIA